MQRKCHRCDRLFTPDSHSTWCPDCRAGKPVKPRKTKEQIELERLILYTVWKEVLYK